MLDCELVAAKNEESRWLMLVLHGLGDSMEGYRWLPGVLDVPDLNYLLVNAPDEYYGGYSWYDFAQNPDPGVRRSRELLTRLLDEKCRAGFRPEKTFLFGFSQGCLMTIDVGLRYPHRLAGLVGISGYVHDPDALLRELSPAARSQRMLFTHGTRDPMIPLAPVRQQVARLQSSGLQIQWQEFNKEHTIAGDEEMRVIRQFVVNQMQP